MSGWEIGDLAVRVKSGPTSLDHLRIKGSVEIPVGTVCRVVGIVGPFLGELGLIVDGYPSRHPTTAWSELAFRKIRPDAHEGNIEDWRDLVEFFTKRVSA